MYGLLPISNLNDFLFCPYSIYLHSVYKGTEEEVCKAAMQKEGSYAHRKKEDDDAHKKGVVTSLPVISEKLGIYGVTDAFDIENGILTEYKNRLTAVYPGQRIQIQAQCLCLKEMGYRVSEIRLTEISTGKILPVDLPDIDTVKEIECLIRRIKQYNPDNDIEVNPNKCRKCIYCSLCEKSDMQNDF